LPFPIQGREKTKEGAIAGSHGDRQKRMEGRRSEDGPQRRGSTGLKTQGTKKTFRTSPRVLERSC